MHQGESMAPQDHTNIYEDGKLRIYKNPASEIFIEDKRTGVTMRLKSYPHLDGGLQFTTEGRVDPISVVPNVIGWRVSRPR
ncbi:MAG: hypothetical protein Q8Q05_01260 [bacterium]|nr:hypothetical protein [bacterium]